MNLFRRRFRTLLIAALALISAPALAAPAPKATTPPGKLVLEEFFRGPLTADGFFRSTVDGSVRGLKVTMRGTWDRRTQTLTLVEDFVFSDGEKDRKTWRFTRTGEGRYVGTREDVIGQASVVQEGDAVRLAYKATVRTKGGSAFDVSFDDVLIKTDARTVRNTATVGWWFFTVGEVDLTIRRPR